MDTMNIALPQEMKDFVREEVAQRGYSSTSEYIRDLIRQDQERRANSKLEALLLEGINSGPTIPVNKEFWDNMRARLHEKIASKKTAW